MVPTAPPPSWSRALRLVWFGTAGCFLGACWPFFAPPAVLDWILGPVTSGLGEITEAQAIAVFREHRAACDRLRDMIVEDRIRGGVSLGSCMRFPSSSMQGPATRFAEYERLREGIGAHRVAGSFLRPSSCEIEVARYGPLFHPVFVGFVFVPVGVAPRDRPPVADDPQCARYTPLGDGWFLLYSQT